jgi:hypothetical protein
MRRNIILFFTTILISHFAYANPCPDSEHLAYDIKVLGAHCDDLLNLTNNWRT